MTELFEFLNQQSGDRLFFFGAVFIVSIYLIGQTMIYIFGDMFRRKNTRTAERITNSNEKKDNE